LRGLFFVCFISLTLSTAKAEVASPHLEPDHDIAKELVKSGTILSLDATLSQLQWVCHGKLIDAHLYQKEGEWRYDLQIKVEHGHIVSLSLNAGTGLYDDLTPLPSECRPNETATR